MSSFSLYRCSVIAALIAITGILLTIKAGHSEDGKPTVLVPERVIPATENLKLKKRRSNIFKKTDSSLKLIKSTTKVNTNRGVEVDQLEAINTDELGTITAKDGGFGFEMWKGTSFSLIEKLLTELPVSSQSEVIRNLMERLLLSRAKMPKGKTNRKHGEFIKLRIRALIELGEIKKARALFDVIPNSTQDHQLVLLDVKLSLLSFDYERACSVTARQFDEIQDPFLQEVLNFCRIIDGDKDKAALGISLMREIGNGDEKYFNLIEALILGERFSLNKSTNLSSLDLAIIKEARIDLPTSSIDSDEINVIRVLAEDSQNPLLLRLNAAERANNMGIFSTFALRKMFKDINFSEVELANPLSRAEVRVGPRIRALLYVTALNNSVPSAQAEAIFRAIAIGRYEKKYFSTVRIFGLLIKNLKPTDDLLWFAAEAVRALLVIGDWEKANLWYKLIESAPGINRERIRSLALLHPFIRIVELLNSGRHKPIKFNSWIDAVKLESKIKPDLLFSIADGLGFHVPLKVWQGRVNKQYSENMTFPNASIWVYLSNILEVLVKNSKGEITLNRPIYDSPSKPLESGTIEVSNLNETLIKHEKLNDLSEWQLGEAILLVLASIGNDPQLSIHPVVIRQVIKVLIAVGLEREAQLLAIEILLARGL